MGTRQLALAASGLALITVIFLLFGGWMSHLHAVVVPLVLWFVSRGMTRRLITAFAVAYLMMIALFFPLQIVFGAIYLVMSFGTGFSGRWISGVFFLRVLLWWGLLPLGTWFTDLFFGTRILSITLAAIGSKAVYLVFFLCLALVITGFQRWVVHRMQRILPAGGSI